MTINEHAAAADQDTARTPKTDVNKMTNPNPNASFNNNSQQYNNNNVLRNNIPQSNGNYDTPGSQGINNTGSPVYNNVNAPGTINNNGVYGNPVNGTNGTYTPPAK